MRHEFFCKHIRAVCRSRFLNRRHQTFSVYCFFRPCILNRTFVFFMSSVSQLEVKSRTNIFQTSKQTAAAFLNHVRFRIYTCVVSILLVIHKNDTLFVDMIFSCGLGLKLQLQATARRLVVSAWDSFKLRFPERQAKYPNYTQGSNQPLRQNNLANTHLIHKFNL